MFLKYHEIENHYREKYIKEFIEDCPELINETFIITEKLDGSNVQIIFEPHKEVQFASRNQILAPEDSFFGVREVLTKMDLSWIQEISNIYDTTFNLYGEIFGPGIQKRINYGNEKQIRFFDIAINEKMMSQFFLYYEFRKMNKENYLVPIIGYTSSLQEALNFNVDQNSKILNIEDNFWEGYVIKPYKKVYYNRYGSVFYIKNKHPNFAEKMKSKVKKEKTEYSEQVEDWRDTFLDYLNSSRVCSVFSKYGVIESHRDIGKYIGYVLQDAIKDFKKDEENFDESQFTKEELKYIFKTDKNLSYIILKEL